MVHGEVSESAAVSLPDPLWLSHPNTGKFPLQTVQLPQLRCFQIVSVFENSVFVLLSSITIYYYYDPKPTSHQPATFPSEHLLSVCYPFDN